MIVKSRKRGSLKFDIHCHYLNQEVAAKVVHLNPGQYEPSVCFANTMTREVNVKQVKDRAAKPSTIEVRLKDMDRMGVEDPVGFVHRVPGLNPESKKKIMGLNAARLLGLGEEKL